MSRVATILLILIVAGLTWVAPAPPTGGETLTAVRAARRADRLDEAERLLKQYESGQGSTETVRMEWLLLRGQQGEPAAQEELQALLREKKDVDPDLVLEALVRGYLVNQPGLALFFA